MYDMYFQKFYVLIQISFQISLQLYPDGNQTSFVEVMAWCQTGINWTMMSKFSDVYILPALSELVDWIKTLCWTHT